ncbi:unnamed protein product [Linum trigynum]|uniref:Uncharacterized protein n=1 Tax=Linum trigynum TaxID=586398 RepID=A0AAV2DA16_9ROSI
MFSVPIVAPSAITTNLLMIDEEEVAAEFTVFVDWTTATKEDLPNLLDLVEPPSSVVASSNYQTLTSPTTALVNNAATWDPWLRCSLRSQQVQRVAVIPMITEKGNKGRILYWRGKKIKLLKLLPRSTVYSIPSRSVTIGAPFSGCYSLNSSHTSSDYARLGRLEGLRHAQRQGLEFKNP